MTIHGRSRQQRYSKLADWDYIYECARKAPDDMQILGNGDIFSYTDWIKHTSDCPALASGMIGRAALIKVSHCLSLFILTSKILKRFWYLI